MTVEKKEARVPHVDDTYKLSLRDLSQALGFLPPRDLTNDKLLLLQPLYYYQTEKHLYTT